MWTLHRARRQRGAALGAGLLLALLAGAGLVLTGQAADHRDGPIFSNTALNGRADINDIYIFRSPANANNTVLCMTVSPFAGGSGGTPVTFDSSLIYDFKVVNTDLTNVSDDMTFRVTFSAPDANGVQQVTLRGMGAAFANGGLLAKGLTGQRANPIRIRGGGQFFAGNADDPFFFDGVGFNRLLNNFGSYPRPRPADQNNPQPGEARNLFGPNVNTLSIVIEVPTARLLNSQANPNIALWCRIERNGAQVDRMGRPAINTALIPPIPRGSNVTNPGPERRNAFNAGNPRDDRANFGQDMTNTLTNFYNPLLQALGQTPRTAAEIQGLVNLLLPDILTIDTSIPFNDPRNGFKLDTTTNPPTFTLNGRRLTDNVIHTELFVLTKGVVTSDNVFDDNARRADGTDRVMDGTKNPPPPLGDSSTRAIQFPYLGTPNSPPQGLILQ
jgi:Domain of unknown function (DUF4331)